MLKNHCSLTESFNHEQQQKIVIWFEVSVEILVKY